MSIVKYLLVLSIEGQNKHKTAYNDIDSFLDNLTGISEYDLNVKNNQLHLCKGKYSKNDFMIKANDRRSSSRPKIRMQKQFRKNNHRSLNSLDQLQRHSAGSADDQNSDPNQDSAII